MSLTDKRSSARATTCAILTMCALLLVCHALQADGLETELRNIGCPVSIDGLLEPCWHQADSITLLIQQKPNSGQPLSEPTTVYMAQDETAIYICFSCRTTSRYPDCRSGSRENLDGDVVMVFLDTFRDRRNAYRFSVNAGGVQGDAIISENGLEQNIDWDGVFQSAVVVDSCGYTVEMAIPWSCLRYDEGKGTWGFNLARKIPRNEEVGYFAPVMYDEAFTVSNFAILSGVQPARRNLGIEVYPYAFYRWEDSYGDKYQEFQPSVDLNWTVTSTTRLQSTINPDFSQVEADPFSFNLSKYALYFDEKRTFFVEGQEYFQPSGSLMAGLLELFYSRQVGKKLPDGSEVSLIAGARAVGKRKNLEYGTLFCHTGSESFEGFLGPDSEPAAYFNVNRLRYPLADNTTIGFMQAAKYTDAYRNDVFSFDGSTSGSTLEISYQVARSHYDGVSDWAYNSYVYWGGAENFFLRGSAQYIGDDFNVSEIGYVPWAGYRGISITGGPVLYPKSGLVSYASASLTSGLERELLESEYSHSFAFLWEAAFRNGWGFGVSYSVGKQWEQNVSYNPKSLGVNLHSDYSRRLWFSSSFATSYGFNYRQWYFGRSTFFNIFGYFRTSSNLSFLLNQNTWIEERPDESVEEITYISRLSISYSPFRGFSLGLYDELPYTRNEGLKSNRVGASLQYNFLPKSWLILAFNDYQLRRDDGTFDPRERIFAAKVKHLIEW